MFFLLTHGVPIFALGTPAWSCFLCGPARGCSPRYDHHVKIDFGANPEKHKPPPHDAELELQVFDWDRFGDDDFISTCTVSSKDIRESCCLPDRRPQKVMLTHRWNASNAEKKFAKGYLLLQYDLASNIDYDKEKAVQKKSKLSVAEKRRAKLSAVRRDFKV